MLDWKTDTSIRKAMSRKQFNQLGLNLAQRLKIIEAENICKIKHD